MRWTRMEDKEVDELWTDFKKTYGPRVSTFVFFLTESNDDDYMIYQGDIYKRVEEGQAFVASGDLDEKV